MTTQGEFYMQYIFIRQVPQHIGSNIVIKGWITHIRHSGKLVFFEVRDGTGNIQCVAFKGDLDENAFLSATKMTLETSVIIEGAIRQDNRSKIGYEVSVSSLKILHKPSEEYPISPKEHGTAFLFENRHLWLRSSRQEAILKIRANVIKSARDFLDSQGFILFDTPILTPVACEGTTNLFETEYFDEKAYLTQSGQLYAEAGAMALGRVYTFGPAFRAEKSKTRRHLMEFWMVEPEAAFFDLENDMELAQQFVAYIVKKVVELNQNDLETLERDISKINVITLPFPKISYDEAIKILEKNKSTVKWGDDLGAEDETILSNEFEKPVMIHHYPSEIKAFYMKNDPDDNKYALNFDMLAPEGCGEIIGGGQREDDYDVLKNKIITHGLNIDNFNWYLDLRKYGSVPHAGFGLGIERTIAWICGLKHVRETIPFPRLLEKIWP
jgi:asparaginyl-tRNA synthetase